MITIRDEWVRGKRSYDLISRGEDEVLEGERGDENRC